MFSISEWIDSLFEDYSDALAPLIMFGLAGLIVFLCIWFGGAHLSIQAPYWQIVVWIVMILYFIVVEWIYIDICKHTTHETIVDYLSSKGFALFITAIGLPMAIMTIGCLGGCVVGIIYIIWETLKYFSVNTHTLLIILLVIGIIVAYFGINVLIGKSVQTEKKDRRNKNGKD